LRREFQHGFWSGDCGNGNSGRRGTGGLEAVQFVFQFLEALFIALL
jgi:hypothetical protein